MAAKSRPLIKEMTAPSIGKSKSSHLEMKDGMRPSLTAQLQQAWLRTQMVSKPVHSTPSSSLSKVASPPTDDIHGPSNGALSEAHEAVQSPPGLSNSGPLDNSSPASVLWHPPELESVDGSGSAGFWEAVSSSLSGGNSDEGAAEAWEVQEQGAADGGTGCRRPVLEVEDATDSYFMDLLADQGLGKQRWMLADCIAYQAMHCERDLVGDVESKLEFDDDGTGGEPWQAADVGNWVENILNAAPLWPEDEFVEQHESPSQADDADKDGSSLELAETLAAPQPLPPPSPEAQFGPPPSVNHEVAEPCSLERGSSMSEPESLDELVRRLLQCAQAVVTDDVNTATMLMSELRQISTPHGSGLQRVAHYFVEGLLARLSGTGADLFTAFMTPRASAVDVVRAYQVFVHKVPHIKMAHYFANTVLLNVFDGAETVHIIDYGILYGYQWPSLLQALATRPEGPPKLVRITGIEFPQPGHFPDQRVKETGRRLAQFAAGLGIPFEFKAVADKWENVHPSSLNLRDDDVLAINSIFRLRHLLDESVLPSSPRRTVLERIRSMNPRVFVTGVVSMAGNSPFFSSRLRETIINYSSHFEALDATLGRDSIDRHIIEREIFGRDILNVTACEGMERIERPEPYTQWQRRLRNAGFHQVSLKECLFNSTREILRGYHENFSIGQDENWLLTGWKDTVQHAMTTWEAR